MISAKEEMRTVKTKQGDTKVFNFEMTDKWVFIKVIPWLEQSQEVDQYCRSGTTIRAAAFGDCADRFYGLLHLNEVFEKILEFSLMIGEKQFNAQVYFLSNAGVRPANKRFNTTGHDYELSLNNNTEVWLDAGVE